MSTDDIMKLMQKAADLRMLVRISPLGTITMRPIPEGPVFQQRRPLNAAEKMRAYRARKKAAAVAAAAAGASGDGVTTVTGKVTPDGESVTTVTDVTTGVTPSLSPTPPIPPEAHTHVKAPDPCTVEEAWAYAQNSGLGITLEGVKLWHASNRETGWTRTRRGTGIIEPVTDWRSRLIRSQAWVREEIAKAETAEAWAQNAKKPKPKPWKQKP